MKCIEEDCKNEAHRYGTCQPCMDKSSQHFKPVKIKQWPVWGGYQIELWDSKGQCHITKFRGDEKSKNQTVAELSLARVNRWLVSQGEIDQKKLNAMREAEKERKK